MSSVLQQTLRGLCFDTGWCYAVFWKLKRQARTVLTWEDAYYGPKMEDVNANPSATTTLPGFGQQMCGGLTEMEDPIGVSVAKMSYHVYSVGEGRTTIHGCKWSTRSWIIGRVAFTNKHQWVFSPTDKGTTAGGVPNRKANPRVLPEKYPSGWENQFAAGIKTIAVIAVPQGVVQLGSTRTIAEDLKLIGHVKALFGTLQNVPGAFLSDLVTEVQRGTVHTVYPLAVPAPQLPPRDPVLINIAPPTLARTPSLPANMGLATTGVAAFNSSLGCSGVGRLPMLLPSQQMLTHAHSMPSPSVLGFQGSVPHFQHSLLDRPGLESLSRPSFSSIKPSCTWTGPIDMGPAAKVGTSLQHGIVKLPFIASPTSTGMKPSPRTGNISRLPLSSKVSSIAIPVSTASPSPPFSAANFEMQQSPELMNTCSFTGGKGIGLPIIEASNYLEAHIRSRRVWGMESAGLIGERHSLVAAELSDINSSVGSPKVVITTTKEIPTCVVGRSLVEDTQSTGCGVSIESRHLVGARPSDQSPQVVLRRLSTESWHLDSRHSAKCQKLDSSRPLTESVQLNASRSSAEVGHLDCSRVATESGQLASGLLGNRLARESPPLVRSLPLPIESLKLPVDRSSIDGGQLWDNIFSVQGGELGGASIAKGNFQPASERSSVASSQPGDSLLPVSSISHVFGGHSMHLERGTMSTMKQDVGAREFLSEALPLPCENSLQTFASEGSHLTVQMSDLLQLAKQFECADSGHAKELSSGMVDLHESISSSLLCDNYFESLQSSMPLFQNSELCAEDFGSVDSLTQNLFSSEVDDFDDFFAWLTKTENRSDIFSQPDVFCASMKNDEVLAPRTAQDCTKWKAQYTSQTGGSNVAFAQISKAQAEPEPILHTLATDQPLANWSANEVANTQSQPPVAMFVNSRIHPQVSVSRSRPTDCDTKVRPSASRQHEVVKRGKKRYHPGEDDRVRSKDRQQIQDRIRELRAMVPDGARCSIDTLLENTVEYTNVLQRLSQDFDEPTKIHDGGSEIGIGSEVTSDTSWVMDFGAQGRACPILVENLSQPRQMLVEMVCEEHGIFLQVADTLKSLGLTILKGVMEARNDKVWARFVIEGPQDVHRVQVLWSLMQLLGSNMTR